MISKFFLDIYYKYVIMELQRLIRKHLLNEIQQYDVHSDKLIRIEKRKKYIQSTINEYSEKIQKIALENNNPYLRWYFENLIEELEYDIENKSPKGYGFEEAGL
jgi:hypothetical protein